MRAAALIALVPMLGMRTSAAQSVTPSADWMPLAEWRGASVVARNCAPAGESPSRAFQIARMLALRDIARVRAGASIEGTESLRRSGTTDDWSQEIREHVKTKLGPTRVLRQALVGDGEARLACIELQETSTRETTP